MNITVYLGASEGNDPIYAEKVQELGSFIGGNGNTLVYGGSGVGLMGKLADAVLKAGGEVIGVEPQFFIDACVQHTGITKLIATPDMQVRKKTMMELGDVFIAFPGGTGTLEEIAEVISANSLERISKPYLFYNVNGYYNDLKAMFDHMKEEGFVTEAGRERIRFADTIEEIAAIIGKLAAFNGEITDTGHS